MAQGNTVLPKQNLSSCDHSRAVLSAMGTPMQKKCMRLKQYGSRCEMHAVPIIDVWILHECCQIPLQIPYWSAALNSINMMQWRIPIKAGNGKVQKKSSPSDNIYKKNQKNTLRTACVKLRVWFCSSEQQLHVSYLEVDTKWNSIRVATLETEPVAVKARCLSIYTVQVEWLERLPIPNHYLPDT